MLERKNAITMNGKPLTLLGSELKVGSKAPSFTVISQDLKAVDESILAGKTTIISTVPSLDTPVCDMETRRFNDEAAKLGTNIQIITISMDLPFAQARWCGAAGIDKVKVFSDFDKASFGINYGVLIKEMRLLARAIFIVDKNGNIQYIQLINEITHEPDYAAVLAAVRELAQPA